MKTFFFFSFFAVSVVLVSADSNVSDWHGFLMLTVDWNHCHSNHIGMVWKAKKKSHTRSHIREKNGNKIQCNMKVKFTLRPCEYFHEFSNDKWTRNVYCMFDKCIFFHLVCEPKASACASWTFVEKSVRKKYMGVDVLL